jgi:hypothetical protein
MFALNKLKKPACFILKLAIKFESFTPLSFNSSWSNLTTFNVTFDISTALAAFLFIVSLHDAKANDKTATNKIRLLLILNIGVYKFIFLQISF